MTIDVANKTVILTGSGVRMGKPIASALLQNGASVVLAGNDSAMISLQKDELSAGEKLIGVHTDITNRDSVAAMIAEAVKTFGSVDCLVNLTDNALAEEDRKPLQEFDDSLWKKITAEDLDAVYYCSKEAVLQMEKQGKGGSIVNVSAASGLVPRLYECAYAATKGALMNMSKAMALEVAPLNIRVNVVAPGKMDGEGAQPVAGSNDEAQMFSHLPLKRMEKPEDIADLICFLCSDSAAYMTGSIIAADGGWSSTFARDF